MRVQPIIDSRFFNKSIRSNKVYVASVSKMYNKTPMNVLPDEILIGWLAHELGHACDCANQSWGYVSQCCAICL
jgi:hypothetical protein